MEINLIIQFIFYFCTILCSLLIIIICFTDNKNDEYDYEEFLRLYNEQYQQIMDDLNKGLKEIEHVEKQILMCEKKLGIKKFK